MFPKIVHSKILLSRTEGPVILTGASLLDLLNDQEVVEGRNLVGGEQSKPARHDSGRRLVYGSHVLHEATMYYPMRSLRSARSLYISTFFLMSSNSTKNYTYYVQKMIMEGKEQVQVHTDPQPELLGGFPN